MACSAFSDPSVMRVSQALRGKTRPDDHEAAKAALPGADRQAAAVRRRRAERGPGVVVAASRRRHGDTGAIDMRPTANRRARHGDAAPIQTAQDAGGDGNSRPGSVSCRIWKEVALLCAPRCATMGPGADAVQGNGRRPPSARRSRAIARGRKHRGTWRRARNRAVRNRSLPTTGRCCTKYWDISTSRAASGTRSFSSS